MAPCNKLQKQWRAAKGDRKRAIHGDSLTGKLRNKSQPASISGKRKRKLLRKWRRDQKEVLRKGLTNMDDVEMAVVEDVGSSQDAGAKTPKNFSLKKNMKLKRLEHFKGKGKKKARSTHATATSGDTMVE